MRQQDGKMYSCPERCSVPRHVYLLALLRSLPTGVYAVSKTMRFIPAIRGYARGHVNSANVFVANHIFTGLLRLRITCVG